MMALMIDPALGALLAGLFALLFASAALPKLRAPRQFVEVFAAYRVGPAALAPVAFAIPLLELAVAALLLVRTTRCAAALAGAALLGLYAVAIFVNLRRGRVDLACGCGGPFDRRPIAGWMVARNLILAALLAAAALPWRPREMAAADVVTIAGGMAVAALLYASLDRLLTRVAPLGARMQAAP